MTKKIGFFDIVQSEISDKGLENFIRLLKDKEATESFVNRHDSAYINLILWSLRDLGEKAFKPLTDFLSRQSTISDLNCSRQALVAALEILPTKNLEKVLTNTNLAVKLVYVRNVQCRALELIKKLPAEQQFKIFCQKNFLDSDIGYDSKYVKGVEEIFKKFTLKQKAEFLKDETRERQFCYILDHRAFPYIQDYYNRLSEKGKKEYLSERRVCAKDIISKDPSPKNLSRVFNVANDSDRLSVIKNYSYLLSKHDPEKFIKLIEPLSLYCIERIINNDIIKNVRRGGLRKQFDIVVNDAVEHFDQANPKHQSGRSSEEFLAYARQEMGLK